MEILTANRYKEILNLDRKSKTPTDKEEHGSASSYNNSCDKYERHSPIHHKQYRSKSINSENSSIDDDRELKSLSLDNKSSHKRKRCSSTGSIDSKSSESSSLIKRNHDEKGKPSYSPPSKMCRNSSNMDLSDFENNDGGKHYESSDGFYAEPSWCSDSSSYNSSDSSSYNSSDSSSYNSSDSSSYNSNDSSSYDSSGSCSSDSSHGEKNDNPEEYPKDYIPNKYKEYLSKLRDRKHRKLRLHQLSECSSSSSINFHNLSDEESLDLSKLSIKSRSPLKRTSSTESLSPPYSPYDYDPSPFNIPPEYASCLSSEDSPQFYNRTPSPRCTKTGSCSSSESSSDDHVSENDFLSYADLQDQCNWTPPHSLEDKEPDSSLYVLPELDLPTNSEMLLNAPSPCVVSSSSLSSDDQYDLNGIILSPDSRKIIRRRRKRLQRYQKHISPTFPHLSRSSDDLEPSVRKSTPPPSKSPGKYQNKHMPKRNSPYPFEHNPGNNCRPEREVCSPSEHVRTGPIFVSNNNTTCNSPPSPSQYEFEALHSNCLLTTHQSKSTEHNRASKSPPSPESSPELKLKGDNSPPSPESSPEFDFLVNKSQCSPKSKLQDKNFILQSTLTSTPIPSSPLPLFNNKDSDLNNVDTSLKLCNNGNQNNNVRMPVPFSQYHSFLDDPRQILQNADQLFKSSPENKRRDGNNENSEQHINEFLPPSNQYHSFLDDPREVLQNADQLFKSSPENKRRDGNNENSEQDIDEFLPPSNQYHSFLDDPRQILQNAEQLFKSSSQNKVQDINNQIEISSNLSKFLTDEEWQDSDINNIPQWQDSDINHKPQENKPACMPSCNSDWQQLYLHNEAKSVKNSMLASMRLSSKYESMGHDKDTQNSSLYDSEWYANNFQYTTQISNESQNSPCEWQDSDIKNTPTQKDLTNSEYSWENNSNKNMSQRTNNYSIQFSTPKSDNAMSVDDYLTSLKLTPLVNTKSSVHVSIPEDDFTTS